MADSNSGPRISHTYFNRSGNSTSASVAALGRYSAAIVARQDGVLVVTITNLDNPSFVTRLIVPANGRDIAMESTAEAVAGEARNIAFFRSIGVIHGQFLEGVGNVLIPPATARALSTALVTGPTPRELGLEAERDALREKVEQLQAEREALLDENNRFKVEVASKAGQIELDGWEIARLKAELKVYRDEAAEARARADQKALEYTPASPAQAKPGKAQKAKTSPLAARKGTPHEFIWDEVSLFDSDRAALAEYGVTTFDSLRRLDGKKKASMRSMLDVKTRHAIEERLKEIDSPKK